jgi:hypothetical protein
MTFSIIIFSIMASDILSLSVTAFSISDNQHYNSI